MSPWTEWFRKNADGVAVIALAIVAGSLALAHILGGDDANAAILAVLALLALTLLRDRARMASLERQGRDFIARAARTLEAMPDAARLTEWREFVTRQSQALAEATMVQVVPGREVGRAHEEARSKTSHWAFKGGTGTYLRAVTLPECVRAARRDRRPLKVQFEIIDPTDARLCGRYAAFRASLAPGPDAGGEEWTVDRTRKEAFATILAGCYYKQRFTLLEISGGLSQVMTTLRMDMSASHVIITQEDSSSPALVVDAGKPYFLAYERELQASFDQSRQVPFTLADAVPLSDEPTVDEARRLLSKLGVALPSTFGDRDVSDIIAKAVRPRNLYQ